MSSQTPDCRDRLYANLGDPVREFAFDEQVAEVFSDMLRRSVPGYGSLIPLLGLIAAEHFQPGTRCYDLGCSLGAASLAVRAQLSDPEHRRIVAVDNSLPMLRKLADRLAAQPADADAVPIDLVCADLRAMPTPEASVVILNFTLQFVPPRERDQTLKVLCRQMVPGGLLLLSEKLRFEEPEVEARFTRLHHGFKRANGYSDLEISRKRTALEKVLRPDTLDVLGARLSAAGFSVIHPWFQCLNFVSLLAWKH